MGSGGRVVGVGSRSKVKGQGPKMEFLYSVVIGAYSRSLIGYYRRWSEDGGFLHLGADKVTEQKRGNS